MKYFICFMFFYPLFAYELIEPFTIEMVEPSKNNCKLFICPDKSGDVRMYLKMDGVLFMLAPGALILINDI